MQESIVFLVRVQCRRKESSRSLSHLMMSFLSSLVFLEAWPWPRESSRTPHEGLGLGTSAKTKCKTFPPRPRPHGCCTCNALPTLTVLHDCLPFLVQECFKDLHVNQIQVVILNYLLSCTLSKLWLTIYQIYPSVRGSLHLNTLSEGDPLQISP